MGLLLLFGMAIGVAYLIAKAGLLTFFSVAISLFFILRLMGCSEAPKRPYCETRSVHQARIHLEYDDPEYQRTVNDNGLPIVDSKATIEAGGEPGKLAHARGW